jgi:hypothetical protein
MSYPMVDTGHDVALASLNPIVPVPSTSPVTPVQRDWGAGGGIHDQGKYVCLRWDFVEDEDEYEDLLTLFNLHTGDYEAVTVYVKNERLQWTRYNGYAQLPLPQADMDIKNFFPRDIEIVVVDLEALSEP